MSSNLVRSVGFDSAMFLWFPRIILTFSEIKCHLLLYFYQHNHRNEVLPQGGPKNKKIKIS